MGEMKVVGLDKLQKKLKKNVQMDDVKRVVRNNGAQMHAKAIANADFKGHYEGKKFVKPTGNLRRSIELNIKDGGLTAEVEATAEYAPYVEYGTRFMTAQPYIRPAYIKQRKKFKQDMKKLTK